MSTHLDPAIFSKLIEHIPEYNILYCHICKNVYFPKNLDRHLGYTHKIAKKHRQPVVEYCQTLPVAVAPGDLALPPDSLLPIPFLPILDGLAYNLCRFYSINRAVIRRHLNTAHQLQRGDCAGNYCRTQLQTWQTEKRAKYWQVSTTAATATATATATTTIPVVESTAVNIFEQLEEEEVRRLERLEQDHLIADAEVEAGDSSPWLDATHWPEQFAQRPIEIITRSSLKPIPVAVAARSAVAVDHVLGSWDGREIISPAVDEDRIRQLTQLFPLIINRYEKTLDSLSYQLCCWLKSYNPNELFPRPFTALQKPGTRRKYQGQWQRFLCFLFRAWRLDPTTRAAVFGPALDLSPYETQLYRIWDLLGQAEQELLWPLPSPLPLPLPLLHQEEGEEVIPGEEEESGDPNPWYIASGPTRDELLERVFELSYMNLTFLSRSGHYHCHCPLVYFVGVLGIHPFNLAYSTAYTFTPNLAELLWVSRLLLLEYALPLAPYKTLSLVAQPQLADLANQLHSIQLQFLCRGGLHAIGYLIELLAIGRRIARKEGPRTNITWTQDGQALILSQLRQWQRPADIEQQISGEQPLALDSFRRMVKSAICHCHRLTEEIMFGWQPAIDLNKIVDNITSRQAGYSYLQEPSNHLHHSFKELLRRAWASKLQAKDRWRHHHCQRYLRKFKQLQLLLLTYTHFTSGMPGRTTEVNIIKWQNTAYIIRNIYIHQGQIMLIFEYNKTRAYTSDSFYIVRVLLPSVSRLWFLYLTYIRPFVDCLRHSLGKQPGQARGVNQSQQAYALLTSNNEVYSTFQISGEIQRLSLESCSQSLTIASYRQVVAAIAKRYIKDMVATATAISMAAIASSSFQTIAYQFGHRPQMLAHGYRLDRSYPAKLQPELIVKYERVSTCWHQWLQLADFEFELLRPPVAVAVAVAEVAEAMGGRQLLPKKRNSTGDPSMIGSTTSQPHLKRARVELSDDIRQAMKRISDFYQSMA